MTSAGFGFSLTCMSGFGIVLTCMAGPRGAGRLGVAAEGGTKPFIALYFKFCICMVLAFAFEGGAKPSIALYSKVCICMVLAAKPLRLLCISNFAFPWFFCPQDSVLAAPAPESWDSLRSTLICVFSSASSFSAWKREKKCVYTFCSSIFMVGHWTIFWAVAKPVCVSFVYLILSHPNKVVWQMCSHHQKGGGWHILDLGCGGWRSWGSCSWVLGVLHESLLRHLVLVVLVAVPRR